MPWRSGFPLGLALAFALIAGVATFNFASTERLVVTMEQADHTRRIIEALDDLSASVSEAEAAKRAYVLDGDPVHLARYERAKESLQVLPALVIELTATDELQQRRATALPVAIDQRLRLLDAAITARDMAGFDPSREETSIRSGTELTEDIRETVDAMTANEERRLAEREDAATRSILYERVAQVVGILTSIVILLVVFGRLRHQVRLRERSEARLVESNVFLDSIVENIPNMVFVKDAKDLEFVRLNRAGEKLIGAPRDGMLGKSDLDLFPNEQATHFQARDREVLAQKEIVDIPEEPIDTPTGKRWLHTRKIPIVDKEGVPRFLLGISEDITERKQISDRLRTLNEELERRVGERTAALQKTEEQLRQSQKLDAIGQVAGGIAHDFNNLLSVILSYTEMLLARLPEGDVKEDIQEIHESGQRAADLTRQLLAFSRQQVLSPKVIDLNAVITNMQKLLRRVIGENIELRIKTRSIGQVKVDPGQMEQVIMNLVVNARDAMPRGGTLTIETSNIELDETAAATHIGTSPGPYVMIAVTDTGIGMDAETRSRIFEPFFTTKPTGKGTGLGLSTVFGIVQQSGGTIWVYSEPGKGTAFKIYIPRAIEAENEERTTGTRRAVSGTETILLVEDDAQVRAVVRKLLTRAGYQVLEAVDGEDALVMCEKFSGAIHLVLTDVVMPKMSGRELADRLRAIRADSKVLYMSGYTDDTVVHHGVLDEGVEFVQKPITPDALMRRIREVLGG